jgi:hypothetical protein
VVRWRSDELVHAMEDPAHEEKRMGLLLGEYEEDEGELELEPQQQQHARLESRPAAAPLKSRNKVDTVPALLGAAAGGMVVLRPSAVLFESRPAAALLTLGRPCDNCGADFVGAGAESCYDMSAPGRFCSSECLLSFAVRGCAGDDAINEALQTICGLACSFEKRKTSVRRRARKSRGC